MKKVVQRYSQAPAQDPYPPENSPTKCSLERTSKLSLISGNNLTQKQASWIRHRREVPQSEGRGDLGSAGQPVAKASEFQAQVIGTKFSCVEIETIDISKAIVDFRRNLCMLSESEDGDKSEPANSLKWKLNYFKSQGHEIAVS